MGEMRFAVFCVSVVAVLCSLGECRSARRRRSFLSLGDMVGTLTDKNPASFVDYGLWCGFGGSGEPVDPIDSCCQQHDFCYDDAHDGVCKSFERHLLLINYQYDIKGEDISCRSGQSECSSAVCICDVGLAKCLQKNKDAYDSKNSGLKNRLPNQETDTNSDQGIEENSNQETDTSSNQETDTSSNQGTEKNPKQEADKNSSTETSK